MKTKRDIMSPEDTRKLYRLMKIEEISADYTLPTKPSSDGYYHLWVKTKSGRRQIKAKTIEQLKEKLYEDTSPSFKQCFDKLQESKLKYTKSQEKLLSVKNSLNRNQSDYKRFFSNTRFENIKIGEIQKADIDEICFENLTRYDLTKKGFMKVRSVLSQTFRYAYEESYIMDNVYERMNFKKFQDMFVEPTKIRDRVHSDDEISRMLEYIHTKENKPQSRFVAFALEMQISMGLRRGEVTALKWSDIHDDHIEISREQITLRSGGFAVVNHTKTYVDRKFPLTPEIANILNRLPRTQSEYLFPQRSELGCIKNSSLYHFYHYMCNCLGIHLSHDAIKGPHSFRRNAITKAINNSNGNTYLVSKIYGNSPKVIDSNYYTGIDLESARSVVTGNQMVTKIGPETQ